MVANPILPSFWNENEGEGFYSKSNLHYKWGHVKNMIILVQFLYVYFYLNTWGKKEKVSSHSS